MLALTWQIWHCSVGEWNNQKQDLFVWKTQMVNLERERAIKLDAWLESFVMEQEMTSFDWIRKEN